MASNPMPTLQSSPNASAEREYALASSCYGGRAPVLWRFDDGTAMAKVGRAVPSAPRMFGTFENFTLVVHAGGALGTARPTLAAAIAPATPSVPVNPVRGDLFIETAMPNNSLLFFAPPVPLNVHEGFARVTTEWAGRKTKGQGNGTVFSINRPPPRWGLRTQNTRSFHKCRWPVPEEQPKIAQGFNLVSTPATKSIAGPEGTADTGTAFSRPFGTVATNKPPPNVETLGYSHPSVRG